MAFGLGRLRLSPDAFWRMTPRELFAAMNVFFPQAAAPFEPGVLARLMRDHPDQEPCRM